MKIRWAVLDLLREDKLTETKLEIRHTFFFILFSAANALKMFLHEM